MTETENRKVPHSLESEMSLLGSMLLEPSIIPEVAEIVGEEDFFLADHRTIFAAMLAYRGPVDLVLFPEWMRQNGTLSGVGGVRYLAELCECVPSAANWESYAEVVSSKTKLRRLIAACDKTQHEAFKAGPSDADDILDAAEKRMLAATQGPSRRTQIVKLGAAAKAELVIATQRADGTRKSVRTGFDGLDAISGGWLGGELIIVAARPGQGKSALLLNISEFVATRQKIAVGMFSLEMRAGAIGLRSVCANAGVNGLRLRSGSVGVEEFKVLNNWADRLAELPIHADDTRDNSLDSIRRTARRMVRQYGCGLLVVDYLQLVQIPNLSKQGKYERVSGVSNGLKTLALELDVPILAAAQLNRETEKSSGAPQLSHLRDSGDIEQDADFVLFPYQPSENDTHRRCIYQAKGRSGCTGSVNVEWNPIKTRFTEARKMDWRLENVELEAESVNAVEEPSPIGSPF